MLTPTLNIGGIPSGMHMMKMAIIVRHAFFIALGPLKAAQIEQYLSHAIDMRSIDEAGITMDRSNSQALQSSSLLNR